MSPEKRLESSIQVRSKSVPSARSVVVKACYVYVVAQTRRPLAARAARRPSRHARIRVVGEVIAAWSVHAEPLPVSWIVEDLPADAKRLALRRRVASAWRIGCVIEAWRARRNVCRFPHPRPKSALLDRPSARNRPNGSHLGRHHGCRRNASTVNGTPLGDGRLANSMHRD
jgi:hypothetical protein